MEDVRRPAVRAHWSRLDTSLLQNGELSVRRLGEVQEAQIDVFNVLGPQIIVSFFDSVVVVVPGNRTDAQSDLQTMLVREKNEFIKSYIYVENFIDKEVAQSRYNFQPHSHLMWPT